MPYGMNEPYYYGMNESYTLSFDLSMHRRLSTSEFLKNQKRQIVAELIEVGVSHG